MCGTLALLSTTWSGVVILLLINDGCCDVMLGERRGHFFFVARGHKTEQNRNDAVALLLMIWCIWPILAECKGLAQSIYTSRHIKHSLIRPPNHTHHTRSHFISITPTPLSSHGEFKVGTGSDAVTHKQIRSAAATACSSTLRKLAARCCGRW